MEYIRRAIFNVQMTHKQHNDDELLEVLDKLIEIETRLKNL